MKALPRSFLTLAALAAACLAGGGCDGLNTIVPAAQPDPTRYFLLAAPGAPAEAGRTAPGGLKLGLGAVTLASYLHGRSMVVRRGSNEVAIEDFDRWAEPLGDGIARVLRARLLTDPAVASANQAPYAFDTDRDYDIAVEVTRCEGAAEVGGGGSARFAARFEIRTAGPDARVVARRVFVAPDAAWDGHDFGQLAARLSEDVDRLGAAITSALPPPAPGPSPRSPAN